MALQQSIPIDNRRKIYFRLTKTDGTPHTGETFSGAEIQISKAGGALANFAGSAAELGSTGVYVYTATTGELDTPGPWLLRVVLSGVITLEYVDEVEPAYFGAAASGGLGVSTFTTNLTQANDFWKDCLVRFLSGALIGQVKKIGAFAQTGGIITLATGLAFTAAPANGDVFQMINA